MVDLELGDSDGKYWADITPAGGDGDYLNYVSTADGIIHALPADWLVGGDERPEGFTLAAEESDLRLAAELSKTRLSGVLKTRLLLVITKADRVSPAIAASAPRLRPMLPGDPETEYVLTRVLDDRKVARDVIEFAQRLENSFKSVDIAISAYNPELVGRGQGEFIARWVGDPRWLRYRDRRALDLQPRRER